jgi:hypothetical protein
VSEYGVLRPLSTVPFFTGIAPALQQSPALLLLVWLFFSPFPSLFFLLIPASSTETLFFVFFFFAPPLLLLQWNRHNTRTLTPAGDSSRNLQTYINNLYTHIFIGRSVYI